MNIEQWGATIAVVLTALGGMYLAYSKYIKASSDERQAIINSVMGLLPVHRQTIDTLREHVDELKAMIEETREQLAETRSDLAQTTANLNETQKQLDSSVLRTTELLAQISSLEGTIETHRLQRVNDRKRITELETESESLKNELAVLRHENEKLRADIVSSKNVEVTVKTVSQ